MIEFVPVSSINRKALIGFVLAILAIFGLCAGLLPIPLTVVICYPPALILAIVSLILGLISLREIRRDGKNGRSLALIAVWVGGITIVLTLCLFIAGVLLYPYSSEFIQQISNQVRP